MSKGSGYGSRKAWLEYVKNKSMAALAGPTPCLAVEHFLGATLQSSLAISPKDSNLACFLFLRALEYSQQIKASKPLLLVFDKTNYWGKTETLKDAKALLQELKSPTGTPFFVEPRAFSLLVNQLLSEPANRDIFRRFKSDIFFWYGTTDELKPAASFLRTFTEKARLRFVCAGRAVSPEFVMLADSVIYSEQPWKIRTPSGSPDHILSDVLMVKAGTSTLGGFNLRN